MSRLITVTLNIKSISTSLAIAICLLVLCFYFYSPNAQAVLAYDNTVVDLKPDGSPSVSGLSISPSMSNDGNIISFGSAKNDLIANDTNNKRDIFYKNMTTGVIKRVSVSTTGTQLTKDSSLSFVSADGNYIVWNAEGSTGSRKNIYRYDVINDTNTLVTQHRGSSSASGDNTASGISKDGRYIVFSSYDTNLDAVNYPTLNTPTGTNVFLADMRTGAIKNYSLDTAGGGYNFIDSFPESCN